MQIEDISDIQFMQKVRESQSSQQIELKDTQAISPGSLEHEEGLSESTPSRSMWRCYWKRCMFLVMVVICSAMLGFEINAQKERIVITEGDYTDPGDFNFLVFCPVYYEKYKSVPIPKSSNDELRRRFLYESYSDQIQISENEKLNYDPKKTYHVQAKSLTYTHQVDGEEVTEAKLFYCGLVREYNKDCMQSFMACSTPGPLFDIPARESVDIIWSNRLDPEIVPNIGNSCMNSSFEDGTAYCKLKAKKNRTQTYPDPTGFSTDSPLDHVRIQNTMWPITMHVHGAEIRPTFDGNPLSWVDNGGAANGKVGVGAFSIHEDCYYDCFDKIDEQANFYNPPKITFKDSKIYGYSSNFKINRYPNLQNPGTLWYHDHAMRLTKYNVEHGLAGFYILRDEVVEQEIGVDRSNEKLVMVAGFKFQPSFPLEGFESDVVYRFRFLNNHFLGVGFGVVGISFSYNGCSSDDLSDREVFSIIGADSSLFDKSIDNQKSFIIANAERMEILIKFKPGKSSFDICGVVLNPNTSATHFGHTNAQFSQIKNPSINGIKLKPKNQVTPLKNNRTTIDNVSLSVSYTNLSEETDIAVQRMRPLMKVAGKIFTIHGRVDFHHGKSENPTLGTVEDWYLINTIQLGGHPIHVHLINFQVLAEFDLRVMNSSNHINCTIYEMDFVLDALELIPADDSCVQNFKKQIYKNSKNRSEGVNYDYLCNNLLKIEDVKSVQEALSQIYPEDKTNEGTKISGLDFRNKLTDQDKIDLEGLTITPSINGSQFKYISGEANPSQKPYYSKWKDTAYVERYKVLQYRIRWTKSKYTQKDKEDGTYFHVPNDQLREYPGFVYHCHILGHEDNEMMRPIMLQLPENAKLDINTRCNTDGEGNPVLNWSEKYECVNKHCSNQKL